MTGQRSREEILRAAVRAAVLGSETLGGAETLSGAETPRGPRPPRAADRDRERRRWVARQQRAEAVRFVRGLIETAALIQGARDTHGERVFRTDAPFALLAALDRIGGWPSISEVARALRVTKQAARQQVIAAARGGLLELVPDASDRRAIQIGLTPRGKSELAAAGLRETNLFATLLGGLGARDMRLVAHVLDVMRQRLQRAERERTHAELERTRAERERTRAELDRRRPQDAEATLLGRRHRG